jgi:hypothetical protein
MGSVVFETDTEFVNVTVVNILLEVVEFFVMAIFWLYLLCFEVYRVT